MLFHSFRFRSVQFSSVYWPCTNLDLGTGWLSRASAAAPAPAASVFLNTAISVEDCFEILVGMKALFSASGFRHNFEMAHSGGVVDRDCPIFAHGVIDTTFYFLRESDLTKLRTSMLIIHIQHVTVAFRNLHRLSGAAMLWNGAILGVPEGATTLIRRMGFKAR